MSKGPIRLKAFVGYQFRSDYHDTKDVKALLQALSQQLKKKDNISLTVQFSKFSAGSALWTEVTNAIRLSDICIFDVSENNPNVMIEVGLAYGLGRQVILLKNEESSKRFRTPSDLSSMIYVPYQNGKKLNGSRTLSELVEGFEDFITRTHKPEYFFKSLWGFAENDSVMIVCSELDKPETRMYPEQNEFIYLSKYGDLDALMEVSSTLHRLYRNLRVDHFTGDEVKQRQVPYTSNLIIIGGPDYNLATRLFDKVVPFKYRRGKGDENDIYLVNKKSKEVFYPEFNKQAGHKRIKDYGFFLKTKNPFNPEKKLIMIGGAHTYGVYGSTRAFAYEGETKEGIQYRNCKSVIQKLGFDPEFSAIFEVQGIDQTVEIPIVDPTKAKGI